MEFLASITVNRYLNFGQDTQVRGEGVTFCDIFILTLSKSL